MSKSKDLYTVLHNVIEFHFCCWDNICSIIWNEMCTINIWFYDGLTSLFYFCMYIDFWKKELKIINCLNRMCTLTDISIIAEWIFLKWRKTCCVYIIVMGLGNSGNKPMGSNRIEFGNKPTGNIRSIIYFQWHHALI